MAGVWKRDGTVAVTNGSKKVTGTGTTFADAKNGVAKGHLFCMTTGTTVDLYEVDYVVSNTELHLVQAFRGTTGTGKAYEIITTFSDSIPEFARKLNASLSYYQSQSDMVQQLFTSDAAEITVTAPDGTTHKLIPWKRVTSEGEGQAARAKVEADRAKTEADRSGTEADRAAGIVAAAALPLPDVWAPLTDSLRLFTGYGREVKVGDDVIARMLTFTRSTTKTYTNRDGMLATAAVNEPAFDQWGLQLDGQSTNLTVSASDWAFFNHNTNGATAKTTTEQNPYGASSPIKSAVCAIANSNVSLVGAPYDMSAVKSLSVFFNIKTAPSGFFVYVAGASDRVSISSTGEITATATGLTATVESIGGAGWRRLTISSAIAVNRFSFNLANVGDEIAFWMVQTEALPFPSSPIPTSGAAATRAADILTLKNPLNIPVGAGDMTVALEVRRNPLIPSSSFPIIFHICTLTWLVGDSTRFAWRGGTTDQGALVKPAPSAMETVVYRIKGDQVTVRCGSAVSTLTRTGAVAANNMVTNIGSEATGAQNLFGHVRNLRVWRRALTDDQMKAIA